MLQALQVLQALQALQELQERAPLATRETRRLAIEAYLKIGDQIEVHALQHDRRKLRTLQVMIETSFALSSDPTLGHDTNQDTIDSTLLNPLRPSPSRQRVFRGDNDGTSRSYNEV